MSFRHGTFLIRLFAALALLCFGGQGAALALEHSGVIELHAHADWQMEASDASDDDGNNPVHSGHHHHLSDMISPGFGKTSAPVVSISPFVVSDEFCHEGPVFGIDHPPQLS